MLTTILFDVFELGKEQKSTRYVSMGPNLEFKFLIGAYRGLQE
jgi:hypothetical protein